jgi:glycosyltransferase involved in cell wall biosynthesis
MIPLPIRPENSQAVGYVSTMPEEGLAQLEVLKQLGCKPHHKVLEIGCGALIAGFPVMQYLNPGNYTGIDPNVWLATASQAIPVVAAVCREKAPRIYDCADFRTGTREQFDFILSHSILSHASNDQLTDFLAAAAEQLVPGGVLAASIRLAEGNEFGSPGSELRGADFTEWQYPGVSWFAEGDVLARAKRAGFVAAIDRELTRTILRGNPKAIHDWLHGERARRIFLGVPCLAEDPTMLDRALTAFAEPEVAVVAVDNGATAGVKAVLETAANDNRSVVVSHHSENIYVNPAWNELAARFLASAATVLVLANADLEVNPGWSRSLLLRIDRARSARQWWRGRGVDTAEEAHQAVKPSGELSDDPRHTAGAFFALPREAVEAAFPIPPELRIWYGDTWIETVLQAAGFEAVTLRDVLAYHAGKVSSNQLPELGAIVAEEGQRWESQFRQLAAETGRSRHAGVPAQVGPATVQLVTGFFRLADRPVDEAEQFMRFEQLAASGLPILLFLDERLLEQHGPRLRLIPTVRVIATTKESLWPFVATAGRELSLPTLRTLEKDTREFLLLQNAKLDLLDRARALDDRATHFAWIDFGIMKIAKDPSGFLDRLAALAPPTACVLFPGCWDRARADAWSAQSDGVNWRFCGGFFVVDRASVHDLVASHRAAFTNDDRLTWEVNVWAAMERAGQRFDWYSADHDDSIIGIPASGDAMALNRFQRRAQKAMEGKPKRICLNMIVKNEGARIERCLAAAAPFVNCWAIADTGSTDDTPALIERFFAERGCPGRLLKTTFKNFSQARNEALALARTVPGWQYVLLIDADMVLTGTLDTATLSEPAYHLVQRMGDMDYRNTRLLRRDVPASYVGVTHEFLSVEGLAVVPGLVIEDRADGANRGDKAERDIRLLNEGLVAEPQNYRYMFYLAQTYREVGRHHEAIQLYRRHLTLCTWDEEAWASRYGIAASFRALGDEPLFVQACLEAYNYRPSRGEPLKLLAQHFREKGQNETACLFAEVLAATPNTGDHLFVERWMYLWGADQELSIAGFYSKWPNRREAAYRACARLTVGGHGDLRKQARENFVHYARSATELFGATVKPIDWKPADGYAPMNPSVCVGPDGRRIVLVRTVNYTVTTEGQYPTLDGSGIIRTHNHVLEMSDNWSPLRSTEIQNAPELPARKLGFVEGYEDCRLWHDGASFLASCTVRDAPDSDGRCEMAILSLDAAWRVQHVEAIRDYDGDKTQKNWMPVVGRPGSFVYLCDPTVVIERRPASTVEVCRSAPPACLVDLRGGSQVIAHGGGWLCITHEVTWCPHRVYLHRFVRLDVDFKVTAVSDPFYFVAKGIEFCAGLARDNDKLVASFGVNDASAYLAIFDPAAVDRVLRPL